MAGAVKVWWLILPNFGSIAGAGQDFSDLLFEDICNLLFKATINLVFQMNLLVYFSPLNLDAFVGVKFEPNIV